MSLQISQNERFQQREWRLERIGWVLVGAFALAGLAGLLGAGPLSWTTAHSDAGLVTVEYQRFTHHEADDSLTLVLAADAAEDGTITVELTGSWVTGVDLQSISPQPSEERAVPGGITFDVAVERTGTTEIQVNFRAQEYGTLDAALAVRGDTTGFTQLVLP
ncbi:MAG TPA: hypothetical protein VFR23_01525 [Jiangellaceae bacterium]|nr:hypothetical protein [Jiangellaceae bacterium]